MRGTSRDARAEIVREFMEQFTVACQEADWERVRLASINLNFEALEPTEKG
ncbi:MAG: hypothetical protein G8D89_17790 [gamma proteobacterium symbiont of Clathrolucina costata]